MNFEITTLIENNPDDNNLLLSEHGLSLYIEIDGIRILFDTGQSGDFISNAEKLKTNLSDLNYIVLSHGHYDHSGGFRKLVDKIGNSYKLIVGQEFFNNKYKLLEDDTYKYIGNSFDKKYIQHNNIKIKYIDEDIFYFTEDIMLFSNFEKSNDFELINKRFQLKQGESYVQDNFSDEIVLVVRSKRGLVVILGCSHIGVVNILETIIKRTGMNIYGIIGGTHLVEADEQRLKNTIEFLKEKHIHILGISHCTGEHAAKEIEHEFRDKFICNNTGSILKIT